MHSSLQAQRCAPLTMCKLWVILCMLLSAVQHPRAVKATDDVVNLGPCELETIIRQLWKPNTDYDMHVQHPRAVKATDDVVNLGPCELETIIRQLWKPNTDYDMHAKALQSQLRNIMRQRMLTEGEEQSISDYDYPDEDKRSVSALAAQGLLHPDGKRSLATLAKNGQLPTSSPEEEAMESAEEKRYVGALARSGGMLSYGKRNVGTLARDFQLPQNGKRNVGTLARLGLMQSNRDPKRNLAAVARYNSNRMGATATSAEAEKRNLGALKGSPVHGQQQKREDEELVWPGADVEYVDLFPNYWLYPKYADIDWESYRQAQKRFLDTSKDPELFGIENGALLASQQQQQAPIENEPTAVDDSVVYQTPEKRHIGAVYRSGFLPSYRALRSITGSGIGSTGGGRFSRSGRARHFVEYYPQRERLRQPIAAVCKRCFLPNRPVVHWGAAGIRGRLPKYITEEERRSSILTNSLPVTSERRPVAYGSTSHSWGTPPRITALHHRSFRRNNDDDDNDNDVADNDDDNAMENNIN